MNKGRKALKGSWDTVADGGWKNRIQGVQIHVEWWLGNMTQYSLTFELHFVVFLGIASGNNL